MHTVSRVQSGRTAATTVSSADAPARLAAHPDIPTRTCLQCRQSEVVEALVLKPHKMSSFEAGGREAESLSANLGFRLANLVTPTSSSHNAFHYSLSSTCILSKLNTISYS